MKTDSEHTSSAGRFNKTKIIDAIKGFKRLKIGVIGDFIADEYIFGMTSRVSREAPVLILRYDSNILTLGGGGNAANNIYALGGSVIPITVLGKDEIGSKLKDIISMMSIDTSCIILDPLRVTTCKTRILAGGKNTTKQQVIRIDKEIDMPLDLKVERQVIEHIYKTSKEMDALIISDYGLGVITPNIVAVINELSLTGRHIITVDSRFNLERFYGTTASTPNIEEIELLASKPLSNGSEKAFCLKFIDMHKMKGILVTKGSEGMTLYESTGKVTNLDIYGSDQIADVTGAGDTVISVFTMAVASGMPMSIATVLSNYAGGIVVMKRGTAVVTADEIIDAVARDYRDDL